MKYVTILSVLVIIPQIVGAELFDILNETYINDIKDIPYSSGKPAVEWQPSQEYFKEYCKRDYSPYFVSGWVDIVGFRNTTKINNTFYFNETPESSAIIRYDTNVCALCCSRYKGGWNYKLEKYEQDNRFVVKLTATAILYYYIEANKYYDNITKVFYDYEPLPLNYSNVIHPVINITEYNNTIEQKVAITVIEPNASRIVINYANNSVIQSLKSYHVEQTDKGIYYVNVSSLQAWDVQGQGVAHFGNAVVINTNLSTFNYSELDIRVSDIYGSVKMDPSQFNISMVTYQPETIVYNPLLFGFLGVFFTLTGSAYYFFKQVII